MYPERLVSVGQETWRVIKKTVGYVAAGVLACAPQAPKEASVFATSTPTPFATEQPLEQSTTVPAIATPRALESFLTPEPPRFLEGILVHAVYTGKIIEVDGGGKLEVGKMLATRLHDQRIHIESTREKDKPCLDGAARVANVNTAEDPSQFKTSPGLTAKAERKQDGSFYIKDRTTQLELTHPDPKLVKGKLRIANPANNQLLCKEAYFELDFQILGTEPLIKEVAQMNLDGRRRPTFDLDYARQSLEAISGPLPNISTQIDYPTGVK